MFPVACLANGVSVGELIGLVMSTIIENLVGDGKIGDNDAGGVCVVGTYLQR